MNEQASKQASKQASIPENHYGHGLLAAEKPFAHNIAPGQYWKHLPLEDQLIFWHGKIPEGSTNGLRRRSWSQPAGTITANPLQKLSCQLHPGSKDW